MRGLAAEPIDMGMMGDAAEELTTLPTIVMLSEPGMRIVTDAASKPGGGVSEASSNLYRSTCFGVVAAFVAPAVCIEDIPDIERVGEADEAAAAVPSRMHPLQEVLGGRVDDRLGGHQASEWVGVCFQKRNAADRCSYHTLARFPNGHFCPYASLIRLIEEIARCRSLFFFDGASALHLILDSL